LVFPLLVEPCPVTNVTEVMVDKAPFGRVTVCSVMELEPSVGTADCEFMAGIEGSVVAACLGDDGDGEGFDGRVAAGVLAGTCFGDDGGGAAPPFGLAVEVEV